MAQPNMVSVSGKDLAHGAWAWLRSIASMAERDVAPMRQPLPVKQVVAQAAGIWLMTRIAFVLITVGAHIVGLTRSAPTALGVFSANPEYARYLLPLLASHPLLASWVRWDASWYLLIGLHGYDIFTPGSSGFFPAYPLQIHLLTLLLGPQAVLPVSLALSNLASLVAFIGLGLLGANEATSEELPADAAARLIKITAAYPFAFFLFVPYTESFFLACVVFSFLCARRGWWRGAAICAFLAGLTRPTAVALVPALAWEYGRQHGIWQRESWRDGAWCSQRWLRTLAGGVAVVAAMPLGLGSYLLFLKLRYGQFMTPFTAQVLYHGHQSWSIWQTLTELVRRFFSPHIWTPAVALLYLDGSLLILFLVITILNVRRLPLLYTLYMLATLYFLLTTPVPHRPELIPSAGRYLLMAIPVFLLCSRWLRKRPTLETMLVGGGLMLQAFFVVLFLTGIYIE